MPEPEVENPNYHTNVESWQRGRSFVGIMYEATARFPRDERFGMTAQLRRAAVSVPSNIAEGAARRTTSDYLRFLYMARGSVKEIETQLVLASDLGFLEDESWRQINAELQKLGKSLQKHINSLERKR